MDSEMTGHYDDEIGDFFVWDGEVTMESEIDIEIDGICLGPRMRLLLLIVVRMGISSPHVLDGAI
jgi:hypothetical protein